jgi:hypothetical protein
MTRKRAATKSSLLKGAPGKPTVMTGLVRTLRDPAEMVMWRSFSGDHIKSACLFSRQAREVEQRYDPKLYGEMHTRMIAYATGAVLASVAFLEAVINELLSVAAEPTKHPPLGTQLPAQLVSSLGDLWKLPSTDRAPTLDKFQLALIAARKPLFNKGAQPYQDADILIGLRNDLVHYRPKAVVIFSKVEPSAVVRYKFAGKFVRNPRFPSDAEYFDAYLGHGCAQWAVRTSLALTDEFFKRMRLRPWYDHLRPELRTE